MGQLTPEEAAAISNTIDTATNIMAQGNIRKNTRKWNEKMYERQRQDALADWERQNEYNHPSAQMARLREAGLNPNLVYGNGADATSNASIRSSSTGTYSQASPNLGRGAGLDWYDMKLKQAQIDNLRVINTVNTQEALLKAAQTGQVAQSTATSKQQYEQAGQLFPYTLEGTIENIKQTQTKTGIMLQENERAAAANSKSLEEATQRILKLREETANTQEERNRIRASTRLLETDNRIKLLDEELKKNGIQPTDNIFMRILGQLLNYYGKNGPTMNNMQENGYPKIDNSTEFPK